MVRCFTGQNIYEMQQELRRVKSDFVTANGDFAIETIDASSVELGALLDMLSALPFLSPKRLIILQNIAENKPAAENIGDILASVSDSTDLYIVEPKLDKRSTLYKTLKKETEFKEFLQVDVASAPAWLVKQATDRGGTLSIADARYMVQRMGAEQMALSNQLDVLLLYNPTINRTSIDLLTDKTPQSSIFDVIEATFSGNTKRALELYDDQRAQNVDPLAIEALFVWQLHILVLVKAAQQANKPLNQLGISPYVAQKSAALVVNRSMTQLKGYVEYLTKAEFALKTTTIVGDDVLKNFIVILGQ